MAQLRFRPKLQPAAHSSLQQSAGTVPLCVNYVAGSPQLALPERHQSSNPDSSTAQSSQAVTAGMGGGASQFAWIPINFYDAREGEPRDARHGNRHRYKLQPGRHYERCRTRCGQSLAVAETLWALRLGSGNQARYEQWQQRERLHPLFRGPSRNDPRSSSINAFRWFRLLRDVRTERRNNSGSATAFPMGTGANHLLCHCETDYAYSPEDTAIKGNGIVDNWGQANLGAGFGISRPI